MIFDQFSRYKACSELLIQVDLSCGSSVLDVGSGPECFLGKFINEADITYVDPLIKQKKGPNYIKGDVFSKKLDGRSFEYVTAIDVLEHIKPKERNKFLEKLSALSTKAMVIGFPTSDNPDAAAADNALDTMYHNIFKNEYHWLEEHYRYGLPSLSDTLNLLSDYGWHCKTIGHGHIPWYRKLLGFSICVLTEPNLNRIVEDISDKFNNMLYSYDFAPPHYRQFIIASSEPHFSIKNPGHSIVSREAENAFQHLMDKAIQQYFSLSLRQLDSNNKIIVDLNRKIEEASSWVKSSNKSIEKRNKHIVKLNLEIELLNRENELLNRENELLNKEIELQKKGNLTLEQTLAEKQAELMRMSDWASGLVQELTRMNSIFPVRLYRLFSRLLNNFKTKVRGTLFGKVIKHICNKRSLQKNYVSFESIKNSVEQNDGRLIITFPVITWDFRWQRPQQIVTRLRDSKYAVLYIAMTLIPKNSRYKTIEEAADDVRFNVLDKHIHQIWLHCAGKLDIYTQPIKGDDLFNITEGLRVTMQQLCAKKIIYLIQFPGWGPVAYELKKSFGGKIVFDCMDEHCGFSTNTAEVLKDEEQLTKKADLVITSSSILEEKSRKLNHCTIQVMNGTEFEHFKNPQTNGELDYMLGRPIIGYYGAISDWFDMEIVAYCARERPQWNIVLIGATFGAKTEKISGMKNVHFLGEKSYRHLPGYLAYFDVCMIPFKVVPLTLATNPVKFYEYLSAGKPVVSICLPELLKYKENCYLANTKEEFLSQLESALAERSNSKKIEQRIRCAQNNSWDSRVELILNHECFLSN